MKTLFLSSTEVGALIAREGFTNCLRALAGAIKNDFLRWDDFDKTPRVASHSKSGVIELMPIADDKTYVFKFVNGHLKNSHEGLPTVMAFGVLADVATGMPLLISDMTLLTAIRTAAMSVVAARALARSQSRVMALIGNGAQSEFQALAFHHLLGIDEIRCFDIDRQATQKLISNLQACPWAKKLKLVACANTMDAIHFEGRPADIVTTVTADKTKAAILRAYMLSPGMHINAVGGDCPGKTEIAPEILLNAKVFVEFEPQTRIEGDLQQMPLDFAVTQLSEVLAGRAYGRDDDTQITVFDSVGFALEDFSALHFIYELALRKSAGKSIGLIPRLHDPKDLFALIQDESQAKPQAKRGTAQFNSPTELYKGQSAPHSFAQPVI